MSRRQPTATPVFDTFWRFACERQHIYFRRLSDCPAPWTVDPILLEHRFTNAYRAADRVSQYLIREVQYRSPSSEVDIVLATLMFKIFNSIDTWEALVACAGRPAVASFQGQAMACELDRRLAERKRVYTGAYIVPSPQMFGAARKHRNHLMLLQELIRTGGLRELLLCPNLRCLYETLLRCPSFGRFLAFQFAIDLNYSEVFKFSEMEYVVAGPGAREGIMKCFSDLGDLTMEETIRWVTETQQEQLQRRGLRFSTLWGRPLQLIDVQNLFCEVGKYARVAHPGRGPSGRRRIKQRFHPEGPLAQPFFPPHWGLKVASDLQANRVGSAPMGCSPNQLRRCTVAAEPTRTAKPARDTPNMRLPACYTDT